MDAGLVVPCARSAPGARSKSVLAMAVAPGELDEPGTTQPVAVPGCPVARGDRPLGVLLIGVDYP